MVKNQKSLGQFFVGNQPKLVSLSQNMINMGKYHLREILNTHLYVKMIWYGLGRLPCFITIGKYCVMIWPGRKNLAWWWMDLPGKAALAWWWMGGRWGRGSSGGRDKILSRTPTSWHNGHSCGDWWGAHWAMSIVQFKSEKVPPVLRRLDVGQVWVETPGEENIFSQPLINLRPESKEHHICICVPSKLPLSD